MKYMAVGLILLCCLVYVLLSAQDSTGSSAESTNKPVGGKAKTAEEFLQQLSGQWGITAKDSYVFDFDNVKCAYPVARLIGEKSGTALPYTNANDPNVNLESGIVLLSLIDCRGGKEQLAIQQIWDKEQKSFYIQVDGEPFHFICSIDAFNPSKWKAFNP